MTFGTGSHLKKPSGLKIDVDESNDVDEHDSDDHAHFTNRTADIRRAETQTTTKQLN